MSWRRKKEPWIHFFSKAGIVLGILFLSGWMFADRYRIGWDTQMVKCIPGYSIYLVDQMDREPVRGEIFAFRSSGLTPYFKDGTWLVKKLVALPGDTVEITEQSEILVNGIRVGEGLPLAEQLNKDQRDFIGRLKMPEGQYWFMGTSKQSFDARYWGAVNRDQIIGRSYPLA